MSFEPPAGILDIGNATLRVGKLEVAETSGLNQGLQNIVKNDLLITETTEYTTNQTWGLKLPTAWVSEFDIRGASSKYVEFNFYNEGSTSNAQGYTLHFEDTTLTLKYDNGNTLASATIPTIVGTYRKVNIFFERGVIAVSIDGTQVLYYKESSGFNNGLGVASRVISTTGGSFLNAFFESDHGGNSGFKNLRIVNGRFISDQTSNVSFIGSLGVGVNSPKEALDIRGNMHLTRVSNVSQIKVDSNVVTEYTGPHDRPLREYPEIIMTAPTTQGYTVSASSNLTDKNPWEAFNPSDYWRSLNGYSTSDPYGYTGDENITDTNGTVHEGEWLQLELPNKINISRVTFAFHSSGSFQPTSYVILGSNNDTSWTLIHTNEKLSPGLSPSYLSEDNFTTVGYFKYLKLLVKNVIDATPSVIISRLRYYGYEEGSGSLDTTLKSVYNVPATTGTQLEVYYDAKDLTTMPTTVSDLSPNSNGGSVTGATLDSTGGIESFKFDASSSQNITSTIDTSYWGTNKLHSVAFWFKADRIDGKYNIFHIGNLSNSESSGFWISDGSADANSGNSLNWWFYGGDSSTKVSTFSWTLNTWYHIALTFDGSTKKMYVNGHHIDFSVGNVITTLPTGIPNSASLAVGSTTNSVDYFDGSIANFRVYGAKVLNADQVKELYDYQKDYFLGSKSQVTLYKGHLGVGVTEPSGQLELAGDERIQEYPPKGMFLTNTNNFNSSDPPSIDSYIEGHGMFRATSSIGNLYESQGPHRAFNDEYNWTTYPSHIYWGGPNAGYDVNTYLYTGDIQLSSKDGTPKGQWIKLQLPYHIKVNHYFTQTPNTGGMTGYYGVKSGQLWGSNDDVNWSFIHGFNDLNATTNGHYHDVSTNNESYKYLALIITKNFGQNPSYVSGGSGDRVGIQRIRYFGTPGPTTLDKGSLSLTRSLDVPRVSRYDVDTETPRPEKLVVDFDTTVNSSPTDISGKGNHGTFNGGASYSAADKAFVFDGTDDYIDIPSVSGVGTGAWVHSKSFWFKLHSSTDAGVLFLLGRNGSTKQIAVQSNGSGQFQYYIYGCNSRVQVNGSDWFPDVNRWYHCVTVFKNNETTATDGVITGREMYIDGVKQTLIAINTQVALDLDSSEVRFGNQFNTVYLDYELSNPKIYSVALEASEIKKLYNLGRTGRSMVISDTAVGIGKVPEAQLDVRGSLAVRGDVEAYGKNFNMSPAGNLSILGSIYGASVVAPYVRTHYDRYGFDGNWRTLITTSAQDCGIGHLINETGHQYAVFWFAHAGNGTGYVGWIKNGGYTNIAYSGSNIKVQGPVGTITRAYVLFLNNG
jgi:hypothetical protein